MPGELIATLLSWQAHARSRLTVAGIPINPAIGEHVLADLDVTER